MTKKTSKTQTADLLTDLYDNIMMDIEPDLCSFMIGGLDEIYKDETAKEKKKRLERYLHAFEQFEKIFAFMTKAWGQHFTELRTSVMQTAKMQSSEKDQQKLTDLETEISDSSL